MDCSLSDFVVEENTHTTLVGTLMPQKALLCWLRAVFFWGGGGIHIAPWGCRGSLPWAIHVWEGERKTHCSHASWGCPSHHLKISSSAKGPSTLHACSERHASAAEACNAIPGAGPGGSRPGQLSPGRAPFPAAGRPSPPPCDAAVALPAPASIWVSPPPMERRPGRAEPGRRGAGSGARPGGDTRG